MFNFLQNATKAIGDSKVPFPVFIRLITFHVEQCIRNKVEHFVVIIRSEKIGLRMKYPIDFPILKHSFQVFQSQQKVVRFTTNFPSIPRVVFDHGHNYIFQGITFQIGQWLIDVSELLEESKYRFCAPLKVRIFWEGHKIWRNLPCKIWRYWVSSNFKWNFFSNFVAFSEYPNFTALRSSWCIRISGRSIRFGQGIHVFSKVSLNPLLSLKVWLRFWFAHWERGFRQC